jgi:lipopolysaccharide/colanic/teichoic acid biosynthesis glycosyltransferase
MGQEVRILNSAGRAGAVPVNGRTDGAGNTFPVFSEASPVYSLPEERQQESSFTEFSIRVLDVTGCVLLFLLAAPIILCTAILVRVTSKGPVFYRQKRVGKSGSIFTLYKFRTMVDGAEEQTGPIWAQKDDERVTPLGRILRRTRIDELAQLFNVIRGDMSLVGPRPERPYFVGRHRALQGVRLSVKPGLTGLAQIRAFYDLKPDHKLKYDALYIQNRSFLLNLVILLKTIPVIFLKRGW